MGQITSNITSTPNPQSQRGSDAGLQGLNMDDFLKLMFAELQNQDPLNPLENSEMLQQISQIREIGATQQLTDTLDAVLLGQNVASATSLIGKYVTALNDNNQNVAGVVERISITDGVPKLHVGANQIKLSGIREILDSTSAAEKLVGQQVVALTDAGRDLGGKIERVSFENGLPRLHLGDETLALTNILEVLDSSSAARSLLLGREVEALTQNGDLISGLVKQVVYDPEDPQLIVGENVVPLKNLVDVK